MNIFRYIFILSLISSRFIACSTLVFTTAFNRPDFIKMQHDLLEKFLEDDFEYVVFSDANNESMASEIRRVCEELGIKHHRVPQVIHDIPYLPRYDHLPLHNPNVRHCNAVQYAWDHYIVHHKGPVLLLDSDLFPIRPISAKELLNGSNIGGLCLGTSDASTGLVYSYISILFAMFDMETLPFPESICFGCGILPNTQASVDSGGHTHYYLSKWRDSLNIKAVSYLPGYEFYCPYSYIPDNGQSKTIPDEEIIADLQRRGFNKNEINLALKKPYTIELLADNHFLHYRCGSNYEKYGEDHILNKTKILADFFEAILSE